MNSLAVAATALALGLPLLAVPVGAQVYGQPYTPSYSSQGSSSQSYSGQGYSGQGYSSQGHGYSPSCGQNCGGRHDRRPSRPYSYNGQQDRPGDYRCDAYWDAGRTDCNAAWRDQRPWRPTQRRSHTSYNYGGPAVYAGEYGRPDVVYSGGGYGQGGGYGGHHGHDHSGHAVSGRDAQRINWCCAEFRSYDPATGYYTAYSGQRIFCG